MPNTICRTRALLQPCVAGLATARMMIMVLPTMVPNVICNMLSVTDAVDAVVDDADRGFDNDEDACSYDSDSHDDNY